MSRERIWIAPEWADNHWLRAAIEARYPDAQIYPTKRPKKALVVTPETPLAPSPGVPATRLRPQ